MFQFDRPLILSTDRETGPIYQYLYKLVEYMNIALNHISPEQIEKGATDTGSVDNSVAVLKAFVAQTTAADDVTTDDGSIYITLNLRKYMGLVFVHVGPTMSNIPVNDTTDLEPIPAIYRPMKLETMDWTDPDGDRYRLSIYANGNVKIHNYGSTLKTNIITNIHMVFPAANL